MARTPGINRDNLNTAERYFEPRFSARAVPRQVSPLCDDNHSAEQHSFKDIGDAAFAP